MNFTAHKNYGIATALSISIGYYVYHSANYYAQSGLILFSEKLIIASLIMFAVTVAGALSPDLDTKSVTTRVVSILMVIWWSSVLFLNYFPEYNIGLRWQTAAISSLVLFTCLGTKHRSFTHALFWPFLCIGMAYYTEIYSIGAFGCGLMTHYYCDHIDPFKLSNWYFNPFKKNFWI